MTEQGPIWPVAIVGAGPVGLCAAMKLARLGVRSIVLERDQSISQDLRASTFHPPTLEMLGEFNLTEPMIADGLIVPTWQVRLHASHESAIFDLSVLEPDTQHPYRLQYEQAAFCALIEAQVRAESCIELRRGFELADIVQHDDAITIYSTDKAQVVHAQFLIAADGASSTARSLLDLPFAGLTYPETTILATTKFPFENHLPGLSWVNYCWSDRGTFSLLRVPDRWRVSLYADEGEDIADALEPARIEERLQEIVPNEQGYDVIEARPYRIHQRILESYRVGRVAFAGDAAHINSPSGGMGMNCGIHDAFNLAEKLAAILDGADPALLDLYDRQRRPLARDDILKRANENRQRMQQRDPAWRRAELDRLQAIAADCAAAREYLLGSSMIAGLRQAAAIT